MQSVISNAVFLYIVHYFPIANESETNYSKVSRDSLKSIKY